MDEPTWRDARDALYRELAAYSGELFELSRKARSREAAIKLVVQSAAMDKAATIVLHWTPDGPATGVPRA